MKTNRANMRIKGSPIRIAVNTMRARLTILGFNLAIITFQLTHLSNQRSGTVVPGFDAPLHLPATVTLYFALLLSVASMVLLIASGAVSEDGACDSPALVAGDLLMYLGLAYTVSGFFQPLVTDLSLRQLPTSARRKRSGLCFGPCPRARLSYGFSRPMQAPSFRCCALPSVRRAMQPLPQATCS